MKQEFKDLAEYRLDKALRTLKDAKTYINEATCESTVNRIYYAMFYAVNGLLILKGLYSSKHSGVRALFNKEIINEGLLDKEQGKFYTEMYDRRQKGDYTDFVKFDIKEVDSWLKNAEIFIDQIINLSKNIIEEH